MRAFSIRRLFRLASVFLAAASSAARADDWPDWGGPQRDLVWRETGIVESLPKDDNGFLPRMWSAPLGEGYSGPAVANGRVYITDRQLEPRTERVLCLDAATGKELWKHEYAARYTIDYPAGPRSTPVVNDGRVYTLGAVGHFLCFDEKTGEIRIGQKITGNVVTPKNVTGAYNQPVQTVHIAKTGRQEKK